LTIDICAGEGREKLDAMLARPRDVYDRAQSQGLGVGESLYQAIGIGLSDRIGLTSVVSAWWGEDPVTLEKLSNTERIFHAVKGTLELIATGVAVYRVMITLRGPCSGYVFNRCFPEGTLVMVPAEETIAAAASSGTQGGWNRTVVVGAGIALAMAIVGSFELEERRRNRETDRRHAAVDGALANPHFLDSLWEHARFGGT
jgi:hypothetical protein